MIGRFLSAITLSVYFVSAAAVAPPASAGPAVLFEAQSGKVLYAEDMDDHWHPASLTKIMTAYLTFEALKKGKLTLESKITYSEAAQLQPPSKIGLHIGAEVTVDTALKALIIKSANDIAVALAEAVGGSEPQFVEMMNATAKRLGMSRTVFVNPNGLPAPEQVTTARDLAKLSRAVVRDYPEHNHYWSMVDMRIGRIRLGTHNAILKSYVGADGLKTGFICDSGYNVVASATRDNLRLMAVVLGESSGHDRAVRAQAMLEHGFTTWGWKTALDKDTIDNVRISQTAKDVASIRQSVMATECGNRRRAAQAIAQARQRAKQRTAKVDGAAAAGAEAGKAALATQPAAAAQTAKTAPRPAAAVAGSGQGSQPPAQASQVAKPRPKAAAPAAGGPIPQ